MVCYPVHPAATVDDMNTREWDAVILGGGVAGLSAAQMLGRARRRTLVIDAGEPRNRFAAHMHGVLGHDGVDPAELLARGRAEAEAYGVVIESGAVTAVADEDGALRIDRADGQRESARAVVVATGVRDVLPDIPGLADQWGDAVFHCPYCHGWEHADRRIGVLATSAGSIHQIELARQWTDRVTAFTAAAGALDDETVSRLTARGIRIVEEPVHLVRALDGELAAVVTTDGEAHPVDAVLVAPSPELDLGFLDGLALQRTDAPGRPLAGDERGATSHPRVWAAGNVVQPFGNVPLSMGSGSMAGAAVNAALVSADAAAAVARRDRRNAEWEARYAAEERVWSGHVNATLRDLAESLPAGTALDVGSGEGADAAWLAERGWQVTAVDVSETAVRRAAAEARRRDLSPRLRFVVQDASAALPEGRFDLVVTAFLHSWEDDFPRIEILRRAATRVGSGGHLLVISHAAPPPWSHEHAVPYMPLPDEELRLLGLGDDEWEREIVEVRPRATVSPAGDAAHLEDGVILLRRR
jgi:thioredoxin reductase/SAM-dependent methyltransferase